MKSPSPVPSPHFFTKIQAATPARTALAVSKATTRKWPANAVPSCDPSAKAASRQTHHQAVSISSILVRSLHMAGLFVKVARDQLRQFLSKMMAIWDLAYGHRYGHQHRKDAYPAFMYMAPASLTTRNYQPVPAQQSEPMPRQKTHPRNLQNPASWPPSAAASPQPSSRSGHPASPPAA